MSKSIHTTRRHYRSARDDDFGSKMAKDSVLAALRDELHEKCELKREERRQRTGGKVGRSLKVKTPFLRPDERRSAEKLPVVTIEEFSWQRKTPGNTPEPTTTSVTPRACA